ncbi:uncharacterized protein B0H18DRAFT_1000427 [Fomitopsis serialis]|uniref:uncharacterized protein n=1 Tax=Fomitopsis serialis TaxID=139415 RepID=UPI0020081862|nr:uncharacterized protein B0H18DRAFT_1000427 [Neoantrodia serialis]KAH9928744.1 hypothetical protein B0H18DRAFT_1000427 [Neoantrodia serialis]
MSAAHLHPAALYPFLLSASPMSSGDPQVTQSDITALKLTFTNTCCQLAAATMIFHEHMITITQEVRYVWGQRLTGATLIFLLNRYVVLILGSTIVLQTVAWDTPLAPANASGSCEATIVLYDVVSILLYIIVAIFSALRAYAICGRKWTFTLATLGLGLAIAIASIYFAARSSYAYVLVIDDMPVCDYTDYYSVDSFNNTHKVFTYPKALIATRVCAILADALLIGLTLYGTLRTRRIISTSLDATTPLTAQLAKDGTSSGIHESRLLNLILQLIAATQCSANGVQIGTWRCYKLYFCIRRPHLIHPHLTVHAESPTRLLSAIHGMEHERDRQHGQATRSSLVL